MCLLGIGVFDWCGLAWLLGFVVWNFVWLVLFDALLGLGLIFVGDLAYILVVLAVWYSLLFVFDLLCFCGGVCGGFNWFDLSCCFVLYLF